MGRGAGKVSLRACRRCLGELRPAGTSRNRLSGEGRLGGRKARDVCPQAPGPREPRAASGAALCPGRWAEHLERIPGQKWKGAQCALEVGPRPMDRTTQLQPRARWARGCDTGHHRCPPRRCGPGGSQAGRPDGRAVPSVGWRSRPILTGGCRQWMCSERTVRSMVKSSGFALSSGAWFLIASGLQAPRSFPGLQVGRVRQTACCRAGSSPSTFVKCLVNSGQTLPGCLKDGNLGYRQGGQREES